MLQILHRGKTLIEQNYCSIFIDHVKYFSS